MLRKVVYLINPISGTRGKSAVMEMIAAAHKRRGVDHEILYTNAAGDYHFLLKKVKEEKITDVVVCGGDGSVNAVAYALMQTAVNIGIIPMGSGNGLAFTAKIPRQAARALELVFTGTPSYIDGFFINDRFSCMLCGIGFDAKVAHDFSKEKVRGLLTYIRVTISHFFSARPYAFDIILNEKTFSTEAFFISVANSNQFGNNFTIAPQASLYDGLLDIVIVKKMRKLALPFSIFRQVAGINAMHTKMDHPAKNNIIYFQTPSLTIINKDNAPLHIDGEPEPTAATFNIRIVRNAIKLIQPGEEKVNGEW